MNNTAINKKLSTTDYDYLINKVKTMLYATTAFEERKANGGTITLENVMDINWTQRINAKGTKRIFRPIFVFWKMITTKAIITTTQLKTINQWIKREKQIDAISNNVVMKWS